MFLQSKKFYLMMITYNEFEKLSSGPYVEQEMAIYEATHGEKFLGTAEDYLAIPYAFLFPDQM